MSLINVYDVEITEGQKIAKNSPMVAYALKRLKKKNQFIFEQNEQVFDLAELLLEMVEIDNEQNKKRDNKNASKKELKDSSCS